ncbi:YueI family protein [Bacillus sp. T33-2]|uniref:YueI family protein n=1 Tax=Bacillus sp. T33-2 TaxID=2054168 RepID=UPI000C76EACE|nr:YueI family protein [Bacillus sp. T33-2]PLR99221.1 DUF1694 domain-containing protein [Bacillus sp. T33-2]
MERTNVDEYLQQGIHGAKQTKPDERRKFLGTLRERVVAVLTQGQVRSGEADKEVQTLIQEHPKAHLYLNGNMDYSHLSKYINMAKKPNLQYTLVTNREYDSEFGLVLAYDHAIDKEDIYLSKQQSAPKTKETSGGGVFTFFSKIFKKQ